MEVTIPVNTTTTIYVPAKSAAEVTESGIPASKASGVNYSGMKNGKAIYEVGSGNYVFQSELE